MPLAFALAEGAARTEARAQESGEILTFEHRIAVSLPCTRARTMLTARSMRTALTATLVAIVVSGGASTALAQVALTDRVYIVQPGDTVSRIAQRLQVPVADLVARNYLQRPYNLRIGRRLRPPENTPREVLRTLPHRDGTPGETARGSSAPVQAAAPGQVRVRREGSNETQNVDFSHLDARRARNLATFLRVEAEQGQRQPPPVPLHPRLAYVLARIGRNFSGKTLRIAPNGRARGSEPTGPSTNHGRGTAVDVRVEGVSVQSLHEFCLTMDRVGCGLHRRSNYVHIDVRRERATWDDSGAILPLANHRRQP
jgi:LysM repeat protein